MADDEYMGGVRRQNGRLGGAAMNSVLVFHTDFAGFCRNLRFVYYNLDGCLL